MSINVLKFGGTSVGTIDRIKSVAVKIKNEVKNGYNVIVVVSAMGGETNKLVNLANHFGNNLRFRRCPRPFGYYRAGWNKRPQGSGLVADRSASRCCPRCLACSCSALAQSCA